MAEQAERQLAAEGAQRRRVGAVAVAAGAALFAGELWAAIVEAKDPTVGIVQGLGPALRGMAAATTDPRTVHERFLVSHQVPLLAAFIITALGTLAMIVPLSFLAQAERLRAPAPSSFTVTLARFGPLVMALGVPAYEISLVVGAHSYLSGHARTAAAITSATGGGVRTVLVLLATIGGLAVAATFVMISLRAMRVGLLTRMMGGVGILAGILFLIPLTPLPVVQALWLVFLGAMLLEFGRRPLPEAWRVLEARPWPGPPPRTQRTRPARSAWPTRASRASAPPPPPAPEPVVQPRGSSSAQSKKRKRRR